MALFSNKQYRTLSKKVIDLPIGISLFTNNGKFLGYRVSIDSVSVNFLTEAYRDRDVCLRKAISHLRARIKEGATPGNFNTVKRNNSNDGLGLPGIRHNTINVSDNGRYPRVDHIFTVGVPDFEKDRVLHKRIYIGTDNTYKERFDEALLRAISLREKAMKQYKKEFLKRLPTF